MTDLAKSSDGHGDLEEVDRIAANIVRAFDLIETIPAEATVTRDILAEFAVQLDAQGQAELTPDQHDRLFVRSFASIEMRLVKVEIALRKAGLLK